MKKNNLPDNDKNKGGKQTPPPKKPKPPAPPKGETEPPQSEKKPLSQRPFIIYTTLFLSLLGGGFGGIPGIYRMINNNPIFKIGRADEGILLTSYQGEYDKTYHSCVLFRGTLMNDGEKPLFPYYFRGDLIEENGDTINLIAGAIPGNLDTLHGKDYQVVLKNATQMDIRFKRTKITSDAPLEGMLFFYCTSTEDQLIELTNQGQVYFSLVCVDKYEKRYSDKILIKPMPNYQTQVTFPDSTLIIPTH